MTLNTALNQERTADFPNGTERADNAAPEQLKNLLTSYPEVADGLSQLSQIAEETDEAELIDYSLQTKEIDQLASSPLEAKPEQINSFLNLLDNLDKLDPIPSEVNELYTPMRRFFGTIQNLPLEAKTRLLEGITPRTKTFYKLYHDRIMEDPDLKPYINRMGELHARTFGLGKEEIAYIREQNQLKVEDYFEGIKKRGEFTVEDLSNIQELSLQGVLPDFALGYRDIDRSEVYGKLGKPKEVTVANATTERSTNLGFVLGHLTNNLNQLLKNPGPDFEFQVATLCGRFIGIHPFADGNGRTTLLLANMIMSMHADEDLKPTHQHNHKFIEALFESEAARTEFLTAFAYYMDEITEAHIE